MLETPKNHLPEGYPLPTPEESMRFQPIWDRAFQIHQRRHSFGPGMPFHPGSLLPVKPPKGTEPDGVPYCDCYELAYRQLKGEGRIIEVYIKPEEPKVVPFKHCHPWPKRCIRVI